MTDASTLPDGLLHARTTPRWDQDTLPDGLRAAHMIADGVWGRLVVIAGALDFVFEDDGVTRTVAAGESIVIPPGRLHHVATPVPVAFQIEFHASLTAGPASRKR